MCLCVYFFNFSNFVGVFTSETYQTVTLLFLYFSLVMFYNKKKMQSKKTPDHCNTDRLYNERNYDRNTEYLEKQINNYSVLLFGYNSTL